MMHCGGSCIMPLPHEKIKIFKYELNIYEL